MSEALNSLDSMASELLKKMPEILEKGTQYGGDLFTRFIHYSIFIHSFGAIISLIVSLVSIFFLISSIKKRIIIVKENRPYYDGSDKYIGSIISFSSILTVSLLYFLYSSQMVSQLLFVPELYVLEYFK